MAYKNIDTTILTDLEFLAFDAVTFAMNRIIDGLGVETARESKTLFLFEADERVPGHWPKLHDTRFIGFDGDPHADHLRGRPFTLMRRRIWALLVIPMYSPKCQEYAMCLFDDDYDGEDRNPYDKELQPPYRVKLASRANRISDRFMTLDSRSSDETLALLAVDHETKWRVSILEHEPVANVDSLAHIRVTGAKAAYDIYNPVTRTRSNITVGGDEGGAKAKAAPKAAASKKSGVSVGDVLPIPGEVTAAGARTQMADKRRAALLSAMRSEGLIEQPTAVAAAAEKTKTDPFDLEEALALDDAPPEVVEEMMLMRTSDPEDANELGERVARKA